MRLTMKPVQLLLVAVMMLSIASMSHALMPKTMKAGATTLSLNGQGSRTKYGFKAYNAGLYLKSKKSNPAAIVAANEPMAIRLEITSRLLTEKRISDTIREGFAKSTGSKTAMRGKIDSLLKVFAKGVNKGDIYDVKYVPGKGLMGYKNGKYLTSVQGLAFKKALFGIWLGPNPAQASLKKAMLGK